MLGNFSFGDYFKRDAIHWAWEYLTDKKWLGLEPGRLSVTVYKDDNEAAGIWRDEINVPAEKISRMGEDENFWPASAPSQGPDGVCGPCSEIYYHVDGVGDVEIWNLVFTQFNRVGDPPDNLRPLPSKNIDTGMGLERTASVLQGVETNYHIDILRPIVEAAADVCGQKYDPSSENGRRLRRITDHVRACTFCVHENVYPGPNKEKYVVKRLLRRAVLDGRQMGMSEPFLHRLVPKVAEIMKTSYPELSDTTERVAGVIEKEEASFFATIDAGLDRIERVFGEMKAENRVMVAGAEAADMYTTHGFPPELFETLAAEHNLTFDWDGFRSEMEQHGLESGGGQRIELFKSGPMDALKKAMHGSDFLGYETIEAEAKIVGIIAQDRLCEEVDEIGHDEAIVVVLDRTPFYGEGGGQVGDSGELVGADGKFDVTDTHREGGFMLHVGHLREGKLALGATVTARVDKHRRQAIRRAHSATHILHHCLQSHLGTHAQQQGSKVDADWLRFDFTNPTAVDRVTLREIEDHVNKHICKAEPVSWQSLPLAEARQAGAMMLFGEKYPETVRMVSMGDFSKELCGGTHLDNTGEVGTFLITAEESVSAGTRRITAVTGRGALERMRRHEALLSETASVLRAPIDELPARVEGLAKEVRELKRKLASGAGAGTKTSADELLAAATKAGDVTIIAAEVPGATGDSMRQLIDALRKKTGKACVLLASRDEGKVTLVAGLSRELVDRGLHAGRWVGDVAKLVGGRGGGRPDMAQAGGNDAEKLPAALESATKLIADQLTVSG
jgi:alanyl-tRNA synthetase